MSNEGLLGFLRFLLPLVPADSLGFHIDPVTTFHMIRPAETIGSLIGHTENAADKIRSMLEK